MATHPPLPRAFIFMALEKGKASRETSLVFLHLTHHPVGGGGTKHTGFEAEIHAHPV